MLKDNEIKELKETADKVRLVHVGFEKVTKVDGTSMLACWGYNSVPFRIPEGMNLEDACKAISYITQSTNEEYNIIPNTSQSAKYVSEHLNKYGFEEVPDCKPDEYAELIDYIPYVSIENYNYQPMLGVADLITYSGHPFQFIKSNISKRYFDWYTENVTFDEFDNLYLKALEKDLETETPTN